MSNALRDHAWLFFPDFFVSVGESINDHNQKEQEEKARNEATLKRSEGGGVCRPDPFRPIHTVPLDNYYTTQVNSTIA